MNYPTNNDDVIDSRDVIAAIAELESGLEDYDPTDDTQDEPPEVDELKALKALAAEGSDYSPDWEYGSTLIRDTYFEEYARDLADDIGAVDLSAGWPNSFIDWEAAADALKQDYTSVDFDGVTYWVR